jgi:hypothetical protein
LHHQPRKLGIGTEDKCGQDSECEDFRGTQTQMCKCAKVNDTAVEHVDEFISVGSKISSQGKIGGEYKMVKMFMKL